MIVGELVMRKDMEITSRIRAVENRGLLERGQLSNHYMVCANCPHQSATQVVMKELVVDISRKGVYPTSPLHLICIRWMPLHLESRATTRALGQQHRQSCYFSYKLTFRQIGRR